MPMISFALSGSPHRQTAPRPVLTDTDPRHLAFTPGPAPGLQDRNADPGAGNIEAIIEAARCYPLAGVTADELDKKLGYFEAI